MLHVVLSRRTPPPLPNYPNIPAIIHIRTSLPIWPMQGAHEFIKQYLRQIKYSTF